MRQFGDFQVFGKNQFLSKILNIRGVVVQYHIKIFKQVQLTNMADEPECFLFFVHPPPAFSEPDLCSSTAI
jgi:hypothetical protein